MCPYETPDGASIGYLKNLAILAKITAGINVDNIKRCLLDIGVIPLINSNVYSNKNITNVFVNGTLFGITGDPLFVTRLLKAYRRNGLINILISISFNITANELRIFTEAGRPCRPLLILKYNHKNKKNEVVAATAASVFNKDVSKDVSSNNWFDLLNGTHYKLDNREKNDDYYYIDKYVNPLKKRSSGGGSGGGSLLDMYSSIFPSDNSKLNDGINVDYVEDDGVIALGSHEYNIGKTGNDGNNLLSSINKIYSGGAGSEDDDSSSDSEGSSSSSSDSEGSSSSSESSSDSEDDDTAVDEVIQKYRKKYTAILNELENTSACIEYLDSEESDTC
jgi:hypothetical protein